MVFTVLQYLPLTEEDCEGSRTELAKKESDTSSNDGNDDNVNEDVDNSLISNTINFSFQLSSSQKHTLANCKIYKYKWVAINTPPPKI